MYKVFLVDDEIVIREGIRNNEIWEASGFVLSGEAPDGEIALAMLQDIKPDILITDIRMPFMDGLELSRRAIDMMPWLQVIILSGYDEFAYAKEAMAIGAHDYLLKPVNAQELLTAMQKVGNRIELARQEQANIHALQEQFSTNIQYLKEKLIQELFLCETQAGSEAALHDRARRLGMTLLANRYQALLITPLYTEKRHEESMAVQMQLRRQASGSGSSIHFCECGGYPLLLVFGDTEADLEERGYGVAQTIRHEIRRTVGIQTQVSLGKIVKTLRELPESYAAAQMVLQSLDAIDPTQKHLHAILGVEDIRHETGLSLAELDILPINQQLQFVSRKDMQTVLDRYIHSLGDSALHSAMMINYIYVEVILVASKIIKESGGNPKTILLDEFQQGGALTQLQSVEDVMPLIRRVLECAVAYRDETTGSSHSSTVRKAQAFLNDHYQDPNISLRNVADHVALSNNHFCTVFSQEAGQTFTEFLTDLRLTKAKELLRTTQLRSSEIAFRVGYNDPHYFSYLFKKNTGTNPREYRRKTINQ